MCSPCPVAGMVVVWGKPSDCRWFEWPRESLQRASSYHVIFLFLSLRARDNLRGPSGHSLWIQLAAGCPVFACNGPQTPH